MYADVRKTENDYEIHIANRGTSLIMSEKEFLEIVKEYEKEKHVQVIVQMCENSGEYRNELFTDFPLWDAISEALDKQIRTEARSCLSIEESLVREKAAVVLSRFDRKLDVYRKKPKKKENGKGNHSYGYRHYAVRLSENSQTVHH